VQTESKLARESKLVKMSRGSSHAAASASAARRATANATSPTDPVEAEVKAESELTSVLSVLVNDSDATKPARFGKDTDVARSRFLKGREDETMQS
jgi:hypothetical protein